LDDKVAQTNSEQKQQQNAGQLRSPRQPLCRHTKGGHEGEVNQKIHVADASALDGEVQKPLTGYLPMRVPDSTDADGSARVG